jgi:hypothetical protein
LEDSSQKNGNPKAETSGYVFVYLAGMCIELPMLRLAFVQCRQEKLDERKSCHWLPVASSGLPRTLLLLAGIVAGDALVGWGYRGCN